jgi:hypothetical protein
MRLIMSLTLVLGLFALTVPAAATNKPCYDWSCNETTHVCSFDASCSTFSSSLFRYAWDFGDGNTTNTGVATITHTYSIPYPHVTLSLWFLDSATVSTDCDIVVWNNIGPTQLTYGRCKK